MPAAQSKPQYMTDDQGNRVSVVLDLEDPATVAERKDEETLSHNEVIKELKADGKL